MKSGVSLFILLFSILLFVLAADVRGQDFASFQDKSAVVIDHSVLEDLRRMNKGRAADPSARVPQLRPPTSRMNQPYLTAPANEPVTPDQLIYAIPEKNVRPALRPPQKASYEKSIPAQPAPEILEQPAPYRYESSRHLPRPGSVVMHPAEKHNAPQDLIYSVSTEKPATSGRQLSRPVPMPQQRADSTTYAQPIFDYNRKEPAFRSSAPIDTIEREIIAAPVKKILMPATKPPVKAASKELSRKIALPAKPPIPPRRPDIQNVPEIFLSEKKGRYAPNESTEDPLDMIDPGYQRPTGQRALSMPVAAPKGRVYAQKLRPADPSKEPLPGIDHQSPPPPRISSAADPFARNLTPDREKLIEAVEAIAARTEKDARKFAEQAPDLARLETSSGPATKAIEKSVMPAEAGVPRPPPEENYEEDFVSLFFSPGMTDLDKAGMAPLKDRVIEQLKKNPGWRIQIQSFASPVDKSTSSARRTSLSRALSVRTFLLENGIEPQRMDVRALGMQTDREPFDRVDLVVFDPEA